MNKIYLTYSYCWFFADDSEVCDYIIICKEDLPLNS